MDDIKTNKTDPLYTIFEKHLYNFEDSVSDRPALIQLVVQEYVSNLKKLGIIIPTVLEKPIQEELAVQVNAMVLKKLYGCVTDSEAKARLRAKTRRRKAGKPYQEVKTKIRA